MTDFKLSLSWNTYQKSICNGLGMLQQKGEFVDMTIAADGHFVEVHQMVLSLVSPYIKNIITSTPSSHPVIFLNKVSSKTLESILEYAYTGEVVVSKSDLTEFMEACTALRIKGLENELIQLTSGSGGNNTNGGSTQISTQRTKTTIEEQLVQTGTKRKKIDTPDVIENSDSSHHNIQTFDDSHMDEDFLDRTDEADGSDCVVTSPDKTKAKETSIQAQNSMLQYSVSCQGSVQLVLNRFIYRLRYTRRDKQIMWRCADYFQKGCTAFATTRGDIVIKRGCAHNHPFHDSQIVKRVNNGNLFTTFNSAAALASTKKTAPSTNIVDTAKSKGDT